MEVAIQSIENPRRLVGHRCHEGDGVGSGSEHASAILEWPSKWTRHRQGQALTLIVHHCQKRSVEKIANFLAPMVCLRAVLGFLWSALSGNGSPWQNCAFFICQDRVLRMRFLHFTISGIYRAGHRLHKSLSIHLWHSFRVGSWIPRLTADDSCVWAQHDCHMPSQCLWRSRGAQSRPETVSSLRSSLAVGMLWLARDRFSGS